MITKPMLAGKCKDKSKIKYPVLVTPKLDGIRCLKLNSHAVSRSFKPIPNQFIREAIESEFPENVDGEIMIPGAAFGTATGVIMSGKNAKPTDVDAFQFWVFDILPAGCDHNTPYSKRMLFLKELPTTPHMIKILPVWIHNEGELLIFEYKCLDDGYEGVMIRDPNGPYKCGRSTEKEGYLLKIKQFEDSEARIIGFVEKMHNTNEATLDAFGHTERSSHKDGMVNAGILGALKVQDVWTNVIFELGTGFDDVTRKEIWCNRLEYLGKIVKYKHQPYGAKDLPRFPVFLGIRSIDDM